MSCRSGVFRAALVMGLLTGGCVHRDWVVLVVNDASVDVIVRVEYAGGSRDALLPADEMGVIIVLPDPRPPAMISLLDPTTCEVRASGDLPAEPTAVGFHDDPTSGRFTMGISPKDVRAETLLPADARCAGR